MSNIRMVHVRLPAQLAAQMERLLKFLGVSRNEFVVQAVAEKVFREMRVRNLKETRGILGPEDAPEWAETVGAEWVQKIRRPEITPPHSL
ncbi:YlcI/YnfO family protein [Desulfovirgula thermocuniculi]|uniref:YlcI/YnfO family protein n=1 Tax=Desulfovirgula thermocuniculi TaxID=348842 RepID=UPI0003F7837D|nr:YlcI/YnfO family protein [Desulfovirgula thermocuniculi]